MCAYLEDLTAALADGYRIERQIGEGGMATVYLAEDLKHQRRVAVKVLRPELAVTLGPERFFREIRVAAQLQHPHILPLHDSGAAGQRGGGAGRFLYYVMPYVEGESLRQRLVRLGELSEPEVVRILADVADALAHAHRRGVVHRDIKPENIMLSGRHALVTDFGVAKAVSEASGRKQLTTAGVALGTPAYMAPEQAAGDPALDHRVDIYALGVLGYELLTGRTPFDSKTHQEMLTAHLVQPPDPVSKYRPGLSPALEAVIMKCLAKRAADRYQSAEELVVALEVAGAQSGGSTLSRLHPLNAVRADRANKAFKGIVAGLGLAAFAALFFFVTRPRPVQLGRQTRVTETAGLETDPVLSPDGRFVAYAAGPFFTSHIYIRQLSGGPDIDLTPDLPGRHIRPRWAPNGDELLFVTNEGRTQRVNRVPTLGPPVRTVVENQGDPGIASADWSPDGKQFAYDDRGAVYRVALAGGAATKLYDGTDAHSLSWSPDGRFLALVEGGSRQWHGATGLSNTAPSCIVIVTVANGKVDTIAAPSVLNLSPAWAPDSRSLFFISNLDGAKDVRRARLTSDGALAGPSERLSTGLNAQTLSLSADGRTLAFSTLFREANVWMLPLRGRQTIDDDAAVQVTTGSQVIERISLSTDGRWLLFDSDRRGNADVYRQRLDQPNAVPEQLTTDSANDFAPAGSPDGREILFHSLRTGNRDLWLMKSDGTNQQQLTDSPYDEYSGSWSPDGRTISYYADSAGTFWLGEVSRDAAGKWGKPRLILSGVPGQSTFSPDGTRLFTTHDGVLSTVDTGSWRAAPITPPILTAPGVRNGFWSADGHSLYYRAREADGRLTLLLLHLDGTRLDTLVRPRDTSRASLRGDWTTDGRRLFFTINRYEGDVWTAEVR